jgi:hypothetical protein
MHVLVGRQADFVAAGAGVPRGQFPVPVTVTCLAPHRLRALRCFSKQKIETVVYSFPMH